MECDVLVLGAGPAGACAAKFLAEKGVNVILVDENKREDIGKKVCGDGLRTVGFQHAGLFPPPENITLQHISKGIIISPDKKTAIPISVGEHDGYCIDRNEFGKALVEKAEQAGSKVLFEHRAEELIWENSKVIGAKVNGAEIRAKAVVSATGMSAFRFKTPAGNSLAPDNIYVCYRERILVDKPEDYDFERILFFFNQEISPGGYSWYFPMGMKNSKLLVNFGLGIKGSKPQAEQAKELLDKIREQNPGYFKNYEIWNNDSFNSRGGIVPIRYVLESLVDVKDNSPTGLVYAGDIGSTVDPIHGGGIRSSIDAASYLAQPVADFICSGEYSKLWQYNKEYLKNFGGKKQSTEYICSLALADATNTQMNLLFRYVIDRTNIGKLVDGKGLIFEVPKIFARVAKLYLRGSDGRKAAKRVLLAYKYARRIIGVYSRYPDTPENLGSWSEQLHNLISEYKEKLLGI